MISVYKALKELKLSKDWVLKGEPKNKTEFESLADAHIRKINDYVGSSRVATLSSILTIGVNTSTVYDLGYIHSSFQINDISIVYREKSIK